MEDEGSPGHSDDSGLVANLRRVTLTPRTHPLGGDGAQFGGVNVGGREYCRGEGVDLPEEEVRSFILAFLWTIVVVEITHLLIEMSSNTGRRIRQRIPSSRVASSGPKVHRGYHNL